MKKLLIALINVAILAPVLSHACGIKNADAPRAEQDVEQDLLKKIAGKSLTCEGNGSTIESSISIAAMYRCINSPVYGKLKIDSMPGGSIRISKITADEKGVLTVYIGDFAEPEICTVK